MTPERIAEIRARYAKRAGWREKAGLSASAFFVSLHETIQWLCQDSLDLPDALDEIDKLQKQIEAMHSAGLGPDYTDTVYREQRSEIGRLQEALTGATGIIECAARQAMWLEDDGDMTGWYDSCAISANVQTGDWLVEMGLWERHPDGFGRHWFYRPKEGTEPNGKPRDADD